MGKVRRIWLSLAVIPLLAGCSSFNREWKSALKEPMPTEGLAGPWEGHWVSDASGHNDRLRCVIKEDSTNRYQADFHANYKSVFHFGYTVPLEVRQNGGTFEFSGEADLGKLAGGVYKYEGNATGTNFFSTYSSKYDHGKFEMSRPVAKP
jgi:hypothetical protein